MREVKVPTWEKYVELVNHEIAEQTETGDLFGQRLPNVLFRGHASDKWKLQTTLERNVPALVGVPEYYRSVYRTKHQLEAYTDREWKIPTVEEYDELLTRGPQWTDRMPALNYLVYLRHHGFPSPLLDWSRSPFIAAFFAFQRADHDHDVAIYALRAWERSTPHPANRACFVKNLGFRVRTHRRHFVQQAEYTIAVNNLRGIWSYTDHEEVLAEAPGRNNSRLMKFILPGSLKHKVLKTLDSYNLNAYTLYGSDDALVESLAYRELPYEIAANKK